MIDIRKLKELVKLMVENDLSELDLRDEQEQVVLRRPYADAGAAPAAATPVAAPHAAPAPTPAAQHPSPPPHQESGVTEKQDGAITIESPMVGTFYSSPDPESPAYVNVGDKVTPDTVVCIVEAMKVFSEIKAECAGTVTEVSVNNGDAVEYGQVLFRVNPD
jgi:acetyl-CoA carboxylase biotin carboxyl carrier protein